MYCSFIILSFLIQNAGCAICLYFTEQSTSMCFALHLLSPLAESSTSSFAQPSSSSPSGLSFSSLNDVPLYAPSGRKERSSTSSQDAPTHTVSLFTQPGRPRLLLYGSSESGVCDHVTPAILHMLERFQTYTLNMSTLFSDTAHGPEQASAQVSDEQCLKCFVLLC